MYYYFITQDYNKYSYNLKKIFLLFFLIFITIYFTLNLISIFIINIK